MQRSVARELDSSLGGEKIIFVMVYTHTVMLTRDECYVHAMVSVTCAYIHVDGFTFDSHECVNDAVSMTCAYIHDNGFTFNSHV